MAHITRITVRGYHCDFYGHVNNARYLEFLEEARWRYLEDGLDLLALKDQGLGFVVTEVHIKFLRPASPDTVLEIRSASGGLRGRRGTILQDITQADAEIRVATARVGFAVIDLATGRAVDLEGDLGDLLRKGLDEPRDEPAEGAS